MRDQRFDHFAMYLLRAQFSNPVWKRNVAVSALLRRRKRRPLQRIPPGRSLLRLLGVRWSILRRGETELGAVFGDEPEKLGEVHTVSSFNVSSQLLLLQRLNALVTELDTMQKLAENCKIEVPMEVLNLIDDGKNPDEFTRDLINIIIAKNQITKGKTDASKSLRNYLLEDLEQTFPDEVEAYREIRATSAADSKRLAQSLR